MLMEAIRNADMQHRPDLIENVFEDIGWGAVQPAVLTDFTVE